MTTDEATTATAPAPTEVEQVVDAERRRIIDLAVRRARANGYCSETNEVLEYIFPGYDVDGRFYDSTGQDCHGYTAEQYVQRACAVCGGNHQGEVL